MFFSFKTVGQLQVIHQPLSSPKQIRAGKYAVGRKIGLERVNADTYLKMYREYLTVPPIHHLHENDPKHN
jgi:hypothetical protein